MKDLNSFMDLSDSVGRGQKTRITMLQEVDGKRSDI